MINSTHLAHQFAKFARYYTLQMIGASVSEPHTSESNWDFSYIIFWRRLAYVIPYILNAVI